jgi:hypothetical protein
MFSLSGRAFVRTLHGTYLMFVIISLLVLTTGSAPESRLVCSSIPAGGIAFDVRYQGGNGS